MKFSRIAVACSLIACPPVALAGWQQNAVLSGGTVQWAGVPGQSNQLSVNGLSAFLWNNQTSAATHIDVPSRPIVTRGAGLNANFCSDTKGADQQLGQHPTTAYYVYLAGYATADNPSLYAFVISTLPPDSEGRPHTPGISFSLDNGFYVVTASFTAVFLGSYLTDGNSNMIPFERHGEEVILVPAAVQPLAFQQHVSFNATSNGGVYPFTQPLTLSPTLPMSAAGLILDLQVVSTTGGSDVFLLDSTLNGMAISGAGCKLNPQLDIVTAAGTAAAPSKATLRRMRVKATQGDVTVTSGVCTKPALGQLDLYGSLVGYVEPVHHLAIGNAN